MRSRRSPIERGGKFRENFLMRRVFFLLVFVLLPALAQAAASVQLLTPGNTSVMGGERVVYSARFFDAFGRPAAGETVVFANDACGFFDNGAFATSAVTDASGTASVGFTARPQGITCWITAQAGVVARFNVFTYTQGLVSLTGSVSPAEPRPGWCRLPQPRSSRVPAPARRAARRSRSRATASRRSKSR